MRTYVVWSHGRIVGTVKAPSDQEACRLVVTMWGSQTTIQRAESAPLRDLYQAYAMDEIALFDGSRAEIMYRIRKEAQP